MSLDAWSGKGFWIPLKLGPLAHTNPKQVADLPNTSANSGCAKCLVSQLPGEKARARKPKSCNVLQLLANLPLPWSTSGYRSLSHKPIILVLLHSGRAKAKAALG